MNDWLSSFFWSHYSKKLKSKLLEPLSGGFFTSEESARRGMRLALGKSGDREDGGLLELYWLIDPEDGKIVDARFLCFGQTPLIGAAEIVSQLVVGKTYDQARRISSEMIQYEVEERGKRGFSQETFSYLNLVLEAVEEASDSCSDIPLPTSYTAPPTSNPIEVLEGGIPEWQEKGKDEQIAIIEGVLDHDIRPYIALDGGGVEVLNILDGREIVISYQGNCTSCYSSTGATLSYIQNVLRAKVHPEIDVIPNL